jgi:hypothetical protein
MTTAHSVTPITGIGWVVLHLLRHATAQNMIWVIALEKRCGGLVSQVVITTARTCAGR